MGETAIQESKRPSMEGNQNATTHALYSSDKNVVLRRSRRVRYRAKKTFDDNPHLDRKRDDWLVMEFATYRVIVEDMGNLIVNLHPWSGVKDGDVQPRRILADHDRAVARMMAIADRLGITYSARRGMALMDFNGRYQGDLAARAQGGDLPGRVCK